MLSSCRVFASRATSACCTLVQSDVAEMQLQPRRERDWVLMTGRWDADRVDAAVTATAAGPLYASGIIKMPFRERDGGREREQLLQQPSVSGCCHLKKERGREREGEELLNMCGNQYRRCICPTVRARLKDSFN